MNSINNPCGHTGFESNVCEICGYPDPSKMIAALKQQIENLKCCGNCKSFLRENCPKKEQIDEFQTEFPEPNSVCDSWTSDGKTMEGEEMKNFKVVIKTDRKNCPFKDGKK